MRPEDAPPKVGRVVLLSGGLDSAVTLAAMAACGPVTALFVDYGQAAAMPEREAARRQAVAYKARLEEVSLPFVARWSRNPLFPGGEPPTPASLDGEAARESARAVWVPARNALLLTVGACLAESVGYAAVAMGFNAEEAGTFPDNSIEFAQAGTEFLSLGTLSGVRVEAPLARMRKDEIVLLGLRLGAPIGEVWSCYKGGETMCGCCESCLRLKRALACCPGSPLLRFLR
ncbi:MAG: 7-cyano-7-deazaguanine synthase [Candidatus Brocadiia bacterium]